MATYILLDPNEIVHQQQAMAAVAAAAANNNANNNNNHHLISNTIPNSNIPNKSSSSNDVSFHYTLFPFSFSSSSFFIIYWSIEMTFIFTVCVCVYIHSSYVYLANLRVVTYTIYIVIEPSTLF
jgi:hypothetical protein